MPIKVNIYNQNAETVGEQELSDKVFGVKVKEALVHQAMVTQMSNERQVLAHTKTKAEVRGGGKKPWKQKGTGRARAGSSRSPIWIGGGITFGPRNERNFKKDINKKMRQKALCMVLSDKVSSGRMAIADKFEMDEFKTKTFNEIIKKFETKILEQTDNKSNETEVKKPRRSTLIIKKEKNEKADYSARNISGLKVINLDNINILDLLKHKNLILTAEAVKQLENKYSGKK